MRRTGADAAGVCGHCRGRNPRPLAAQHRGTRGSRDHFGFKKSRTRVRRAGRRLCHHPRSDPQIRRHHHSRCAVARAQSQCPPPRHAELLHLRARLRHFSGLEQTPAHDRRAQHLFIAAFGRVLGKLRYAARRCRAHRSGRRTGRNPVGRQRRQRRYQYHHKVLQGYSGRAGGSCRRRIQ